MPETIIKEVELQKVTGNINLTLGADGKNIDIPRDSQGKIIIDSTTPTSTESVNVSLKNIEQNIADDENIYGAKNLIPIGQSSSMFIVNGDGTILINGTASSTGSSYIITFPEVMNDAYKFTIDYNGTWNSNVVVQLLAANNVVKAQFDQTIGGMQEINISANSSIIYFKIDVIPSGSVFNMTIKPMLRLASIKDRTYVPYAMTNKELTNKINNLHTNFSELDDVNFNNLQNGQVPKYDSSSQKWINGVAEDNKVLQNPSSTNEDYEILFSETADNNPHTGSAKKNNNLKFNPNTGNLQVTKINGIDIGSTPQFTDDKVQQISTPNNDYNYMGNYEILFSYSNNDNTETNAVRKNASIKYNPYNNSFSHGKNTISNGTNSHAEGELTDSQGSNSHAEGHRTTANYIATHSEGNETMADYFYSHSEGSYTRAYGEDSHTEGYGTQTGDSQNRHSSAGLAAHSEGWYTKAIGQISHAEGSGTCALGQSSHAEGYTSTYYASNNKPGILTLGEGSHAEGYSNRHFLDEKGIIQAIGDGSHAEGYVTTADITQAIGKGSHAEGTGTTAGGEGSHTEGIQTKALGPYSHTEGCKTYTHDKKEIFAFVNNNNDALPYDFEDGAAVVYDNKIYLISSNVVDCGRNWAVFDGNNWQQSSSSLGHDMKNTAAVVYDNKIYCFGGWEQPAANWYSIFDGNSWTTLQMPDSLLKTSAVVYNGKIYIVGNNAASEKKAYIFDGQVWTSWTLFLNVLGTSGDWDSRYSQMIDYNGNMYIFYYGIGYLFDGSTINRFEDGDTIIQNTQLIVYNNKIYNFGYSTFENKIYTFTNETGWEEIISTPEFSRYFCASRPVVYKDQIYILGGSQDHKACTIYEDGYINQFGSHAEGYKTSALQEYCHAAGCESIANNNYSYALGYKGNTDTENLVTKGESYFAIGGDRSNLESNEYYTDTSSNNVFHVDSLGNLFTTGAHSLMCGTLIGGTGTTTSGGSDIVKIPLEDGAIYFLHANGVNKNTNAKFGIGSYLIGATGVSATTSAAAVGTSGAIGTGGTNPLRVFNLATTTTDSTGRYHSILGIGTSTSVIKLRWNLVKVLGSLNDFDWDE